MTIDVAPATLGISVIIRNEKGEDMTALLAKRFATIDSDEAELIAYRKVICFAIEVRFKEL